MVERKIPRGTIADTIEMRSWKGYFWAWVGISAAVVALFVVPTSLGHPAIFSDNLNQNVPLHYLAAQIEKSGHIPTWNRYSWSGNPLLAGFNVQTFFPLSILFLFLSPVWAFTWFVVIVYSLGAGGVIASSRDLGASPAGAALAAIGFTLSGQFLSQVVHLDMIAGIACVTWCIVFLLKIVSSQSVRSGAIWAVLLSVGFALCVFAGAPEAMLDGAIFMALLAIPTMIKRGRDSKVPLLLLLLAGALALGLAAIQWLPGIAFQHFSNRSSGSYAFFTSGPFSPRDLVMLLYPFIQGWYSLRDLPSFFGSYNLGEIGSYLPILLTTLGLVGLLSSSDTPNSDGRVSGIRLAGIGALLLALGGYTPLAPLLYHLPLYGKQRLPSRNMFGFDLAISILAGLVWTKVSSKGKPLSGTGRLVVYVIGSIGVIVAAGFFFDTSLLYSILTTPSQISGFSTNMAIYVALSCALIVATTAVIATSRSGGLRRSASTALALLALLDIGVFSYSTVVEQTPPTYLNSPGGTTLAKLKSLVGPAGRFGIYDPNLYSYFAQNTALSVNSNIYSQVPSVQGYSSLSLGNYDALTGSHFMGTMKVSGINSVMHDIYNMNLLETNSYYFLIGVGSSAAKSAPLSPSAPSSSNSPIQTGGFFGGNFNVLRLLISTPRGMDTQCLDGLSLLTSSGGKIKASSAVATTTPNGNPIQEVSFPQPTSAVGFQIPPCSGLPSSDGYPDLGIRLQTPNHNYDLTGSEITYLTPTNWHYIENIGNLAIYASNHPKTSIFKLGSGVKVDSFSISTAGALTLTVHAVHSSTIIWNENYAPSWNETVINSEGTKRPALHSAANSTLISISVPKGVSKIELSYRAPMLLVGFYISICSLVLALGILLWTRFHSRKKGSWKSGRMQMSVYDIRRG